MTVGGQFTCEGVDISVGSTTDVQASGVLRCPCGGGNQANNLQISWVVGGPAGGTNTFHLDNVTSAVCSDLANVDPGVPAASFDTISITGTGRVNLAGAGGMISNATIQATFTDAGEGGEGGSRGVNDTTNIVIRRPNGDILLDCHSVTLTIGNYQAHAG